MKKYNQFIKEKYEDIDPYGEENWNEDISTDYLNSVVDYLDIKAKLETIPGDKWCIYFKKDGNDYRIYNKNGRIFLRILSEYEIDDIELEDSDWLTIRLAMQRLDILILYKKFLNESHYETFDPLSGITSKVKITVDGGKSLVNRLIENLSLIVKKRSSKSIKVNSINGYVDKEVFIRRGIYYDTYLEIELINKDYIVGEFKSINGNITIRINDHLVYDMDSRHFDNEVLIDKIVSEYKKYLKDNKFIINEALKFRETDLSVKMDDVSIDYLNENFTNCWVKIINELDDYLMWVVNFYKNTDHGVSIKYNKFKYCGNPIEILNYEDSYHIKKQDNKIIKYEEYISGQKFTDIDPYGEEDWDDTNEKKTYIDNGKEVEVINIYELLKEYSTFETSKLLRKITKGKLVRVQINRKSKWVDHWQCFDKYVNILDVYPLDFERIILRIEYNEVISDMCINKRNRLLIKERKRIFTVEDPYGEEDWGDD